MAVQGLRVGGTPAVVYGGLPIKVFDGSLGPDWIAEDALLRKLGPHGLSRQHLWFWIRWALIQATVFFYAPHRRAPCPHCGKPAHTVFLFMPPDVERQLIERIVGDLSTEVERAIEATIDRTGQSG